MTNHLKQTQDLIFSYADCFLKLYKIKRLEIKLKLKIICTRHE